MSDEQPPVIYVDKIPGQYFARYPGGIDQKERAHYIFFHTFGRAPEAFYVKGEFIYMPITEEEGSRLVTLARVH